MFKFPWRQQQQHATIQELEDDATAAAFLAGGTQKQSSMSIPIGSALGAGGLPFDPTLPPALQKYSRQVMSRSNSDAFIGPASVVNPYTGFMPASASQAPTAAQAQAPQIVRLPINMEIERNKAAADYYRNPISAIRAEIAEAQEREMVEKQLAKAQRKAEREEERRQKHELKLLKEELRLRREMEEDQRRLEKKLRSTSKGKGKSKRRARKRSSDEESVSEDRPARSESQSRGRSRRHSRADSSERAQTAVEPLKPRAIPRASGMRFEEPPSPVERTRTTGPSEYRRTDETSWQPPGNAVSYPPHLSMRYRVETDQSLGRAPSETQAPLSAVNKGSVSAGNKSRRPSTPFASGRPLEGMTDEEDEHPARAHAQIASRNVAKQAVSLPVTPPAQRSPSPPRQQSRSKAIPAAPFTPPMQRSPSPPRTQGQQAEKAETAMRRRAHSFSHTPQEARLIRPHTPEQRMSTKRPPLTKPTARPGRAEVMDVRFREVTHYLTMLQVTRDAPNAFTRALEQFKHKVRPGHLVHIDAKSKDPVPFSIILDWFDGKDILPLTKSQLVLLTGKTDTPDEAYAVLHREAESYGLTKLTNRLQEYLKPAGEEPDYTVEDGPRRLFEVFDIDDFNPVNAEDLEQVIKSHKPGKNPTIGLPTMRLVMIDAAINFGGKLRPLPDGTDAEQLLIYHIRIQPGELAYAFRNLLHWKSHPTEEGFSLAGELTRKQASAVTFDIEHYDESAVFQPRIVGPPRRQKIIRNSSLRELCDGLNPMLNNALYPWNTTVLDAVRVKRLVSEADEEPLPFDYHHELREATAIYINIPVALVVAEVSFPKHKWDVQEPVIRLKSVATTSREIRKENQYQSAAGSTTGTADH